MKEKCPPLSFSSASPSTMVSPAPTLASRLDLYARKGDQSFPFVDKRSPATSFKCLILKYKI